MINDSEISSEIKELGFVRYSKFDELFLNQEMFMIYYFYKFGDIQLPKCDFFHTQHDVHIPTVGTAPPDLAATRHPRSKCHRG